METLRMENVGLTYQTAEGETEALKNINLSVNDGEFVAIIGPSGCGKTTILSLIAGLIKSTTGKITLEGKSISEKNNFVGYMLQRDQLFEWRTILANATLGLEIKKTLTSENKNYVINMLTKYGLGEFINSRPAELSGGMRQRAALIRTLAYRPKILLLDEPFSALDYQTRLNVCDDVHNIIKSEHKTALLVTHDISDTIYLYCVPHNKKATLYFHKVWLLCHSLVRLIVILISARYALIYILTLIIKKVNRYIIFTAK